MEASAKKEAPHSDELDVEGTDGRELGAESQLRSTNNRNYFAGSSCRVCHLSPESTQSPPHRARTKGSQPAVPPAAARRCEAG